MSQLIINTVPTVNRPAFRAGPLVNATSKIMSDREITDMADAIVKKVIEAQQTPDKKAQEEKMRKDVASRYGEKVAACLHGVALEELAGRIESEAAPDMAANAQRPSLAPDPATYFAPKMVPTGLTPDPAEYFRG